MKKKVLWAAVIAALFVVLAILLVALSNSEKTNSGPVIEIVKESMQPVGTEQPIEAQSEDACPEQVVEQEEESEVVPKETTMPEQQNKDTSGEAFRLQIKGKTICVAYGVDENTLKKTPGWLATSTSPGQEGMCVVYGHRNRTHLRVLENVEEGDPITITMPDGTCHTYTVTDKLIYEKTEDMRLPMLDGRTLALVTCYPFRYSGHAPGKCVVAARM